MTAGEVFRAGLALDELLPDERPLLLLVNSGKSPHYREWVLQGVARHYRLWLLDARKATWDRPYIEGQTLVDVLDLDQGMAAAKELAARLPLAGVFCYDEMRIWQAARIAEALGVPTSTPESIRACRDKRLSRERMAAMGPGAVRSIPVGDVTEALKAAEEIGYPVILKPRGLAASEGVAKADGPGRLRELFEFSMMAHFPEVPAFEDHGVLVEEYLDGREITVDAVVWRGELHPAFISHKRLDLPPTFEETGHIVTAGDPLLHDEEVLGVVQAAHRALGFEHGLTHTEVRLTSRGPRIVEVNGRLGGDLITYVGLLATGIDLGVAAARLAAGEFPDLTPRRRCTATVRYFYPDHDMVVEEASLDPARLPAGIWEVKLFAEPGRTLLRPPRSFVKGRVAAGFAVGADEEACARSLDALGAALRVRGREVGVGAA